MNFTIALSVFMLGATAFVVFTKQLINALIAMSIFSMVLVVYYFLLQAPDVAITEAALGAGLSTIIFLIAIRKVKERKHMLDLRRYFTGANVRLLTSSESGEILRELLDLALRELPENDRASVEHIIRDRKQIQEINIGKGIALAHERYDELEELYVSIGLLKQPVRYQKGAPVQMVLCVLLPNSKSREYLSMMAKFTRFLETKEIENFVPPAVPPSAASETFLQAITEFEEGRG